MTQTKIHDRVDELLERQLPLDRAIEQAAWEMDHPGEDLPEWTGVTDRIASPAEATIAGGNCQGCEADSAELLPWASQRLCWNCVDVQLDLLAMAVMEAGAVPVVMAVAA